MHGSIRQLVCPACGDVTEMSPATHAALRTQTPIACPACRAGVLRCRVMLYDDAEGACTLTRMTALPRRSRC